MKYDNDTLFGPPVRVDRCGTEHDTTHWTPAEDAVLWAVLPLCRSRVDYRETCVRLLTALQRLPNRVEDDDDRYFDLCVRNVQNRMITRHMDVGEKYEALNADLLRFLSAHLGQYRTGRAWAWGERFLVGRYYEKLHNLHNDQAQACEPDRLLTLFSRGESDEPVLRQLLALFADAGSGWVRPELGRLIRTDKMFDGAFARRLKDGDTSAWRNLTFWAHGQVRDGD